MADASIWHLRADRALTMTHVTRTHSVKAKTSIVRPDWRMRVNHKYSTPAIHVQTAGYNEPRGYDTPTYHPASGGLRPTTLLPLSTHQLRPSFRRPTGIFRTGPTHPSVNNHNRGGRGRHRKRKHPRKIARIQQVFEKIDAGPFLSISCQ